jgi:uncharacterized protein
LTTTAWEPLPASERYRTLDLLRGFALFGVLMVNLLTIFRISLFEQIVTFHTHPGWLNYAVDNFSAGVLEFKSFNLFSLTLGMGVAVQAERAQQRGVVVEFFLARRFLILLVAGVAHLVLVSNVDILTLYAVCGFVLILFLRLPTAVLAIAGLAAIYLPSVLPLGPVLPPQSVLRSFAATATQEYAHGSFVSILLFRWTETRELMAPLVESVAQRSLGLMMLGAALWRAGVVRDPARFRRPLWTICLLAGLVGTVNTSAEIWGFHVPRLLRALGSNIPLAFAYAAALMAWRRSAKAWAVVAPVAAAGQMALTNYLTQTILFAFVFYGFGLGLMGKLSPVQAATGGVALYAAQLWFSVWWLRRYRFGPFEWLWRSATYGHWQRL